MGGKGRPSVSTSTVTIPPEVLARYNAVNLRAENVAQQPFQLYGGEFVAPLTQTQQAGISNISQAAGSAQPFFGAATQALLGGATQAQPYYQAATESLYGGLGAAQPLQQQALANIYGAQAGARPFQELATGFGLAGARGVQPGALDIGTYMSPFTQAVAAPTFEALRQQQQQEQQKLLGDQIRGGAFGGDRGRIAAANLAQQQNLATSQALGNIFQQGYGQALGAAQQQQQLRLAAEQANRQAQQQAAQQFLGIGQQGFGQGITAAQQQAALAQQQFGQGAQASQQQQALGQGLYGIGAGVSQGLAGLGTGAQQAALQGGQAQLAAGTVEQQTQQALNQALYNQFLQQQGYPFQVAQFLANIAMGTGALSGSTTTTVQPQPFFSDERLKEDVEPIGKTYDGQDIVRFKYKGEPGTRIGLIAQDVEKKHPEAVGTSGGFKTVDYEKATEHAAERAPKAYGGGLNPVASMGGGVFRENAGEGYAAGGAPGRDDILAQINALVNSHQGVFPYGRVGMYGSSMGRSGPYGATLMEPSNRRLMTAQPVGGRLPTGMEQLETATRQGAAFGNLYRGARSGLGFLREQSSFSPEYQQQGPTPSGAPVSAPQTLRDYLDYLGNVVSGGTSSSEASGSSASQAPGSKRGGAVRAGLATGGLPYSEARNEHVPEDLSKPLMPQTLQPARTPGQQQSGAGSLLSGLGQIGSAVGGLKGLGELGSSIGSGLGSIGSTIGTALGSGGLEAALAALPSLFSDERLKEEIQPIGKTFDGQEIVRFKYKGEPETRIGLIAQDVEKKHPEAVGLAGGFKTVDYRKATDDAAHRRGYQAGGSPEQGQNPAIPDDLLPFISRIETGNRPDAAHATNPLFPPERGGPVGRFQFTRNTFLDLARNDPRFQGKTEEEILGARTNDELASEFALRLANQNASVLRSAGLEPTRENLALAHMQGGAGATALLQNPTGNALDVLTGVYGGNRDRAMEVLRQNRGNPNMTAAEFSAALVGGGRGAVQPQQPAAGLGAGQPQQPAAGAGQQQGAAEGGLGAATQPGAITNVAPPRELPQRPPGDWLSRNESWMVPLLTGLGTMAASPSRYLGSAVLQGLAGAAQSYQQTQTALGAREKAFQEAQQIAEQGGLTRQQAESINAAIARGAIDRQTGRVFFYLRDGRISSMSFGEYLQRLTRGEQIQLAPPRPGMEETRTPAQVPGAAAPAAATQPPSQAPQPGAIQREELPPPTAPAATPEAAPGAAPGAGAVSGARPVEGGAQAPIYVALPPTILERATQNAQTLTESMNFAGNLAAATRLVESGNDPFNVAERRGAVAAQTRPERNAYISSLANLASTGGPTGAGVFQSRVTAPMIEWYNSIIDTLPLPPEVRREARLNPSQIADREVISKVTSALEMQRTTEAGQRALGALNVALRSVPQASNSPEAIAKLGAEYLIDNQRAIDFDRYANLYRNALLQNANLDPALLPLAARDMTRMFDEYQGNRYGLEQTMLEHLLRARFENRPVVQLIAESGGNVPEVIMNWMLTPAGQQVQGARQGVTGAGYVNERAGITPEMVRGLTRYFLAQR